MVLTITQIVLLMTTMEVIEMEMKIWMLVNIVDSDYYNGWSYGGQWYAWC